MTLSVTKSSPRVIPDYTLFIELANVAELKSNLLTKIISPITRGLRNYTPYGR